ncbi:uncharacterized protein LOC126677099 [Mercurialis annua]|uniref:uncharacterized protein LOC126677099 n=1 Tax=Mercurialis annua TaxID=3986 RepID=UPI0021605CA5|nr:uncharacterized protein LOC126677099 [Mercurialis annua]
MAPTQQQEDDKEEEEEEAMDPNKILLPDKNEESQTKSTSEHQHYISSINSAILIRQLPSQGLSFQLWPAATTLFTLLNNHRSNPTLTPLSPIFSSTSKLNILELGSGTGLVGIAAAAILGANVTVTDLPHVIPNLQFNAEANAGVVAVNGGTVEAAALRWGKVGGEDVELIGNDFDVILGSDVVYYEELYEPLLYTLRLVMGDSEKKKKKVFVMAHLRRWKKDSVFFKKAKKLFDVSVVYVDKPSEGRRIGVSVYLFAQKAQKLLPAN